MNIAVCDDNPQHLQFTANFILQQISSLSHELTLFESAENMMNAITDHLFLPDIAVLDIDLGNENGIDLAKQINQFLPRCQIIFLTGYTEYVSASYEADHVWYVLKSSADTYLPSAIRRAIRNWLGEPGTLGITAKASGKTFFLPVKKVLYLDRYGRKARIVCIDDIYPVSGTPGSYITSRLEPFFVRCHQGYWVNLSHVKALEKNEFILSNGQRIPISRSYRENTRQRFFAKVLE